MIGIDIGTKYIKLASLEKKEQAFHIRYALMGLNPSQAQGAKQAFNWYKQQAAGTNPSLGQGAKQDGLLSSKIKSIAKESFPFDKRVAASIGGCQIISRNLEFASLGDEELQGAVLLEAKQSVSADLASMYSDYQVLSTLENSKLDTLFIAVPSNIVDRQVHLIESSGLNIEIVDIDNLAMTNCYNALDKNAKKQSVVLLDIGHSYTNIAVIDAGALRFVRNVNFGGANITAEIGDIYQLPQETAEEIKKRPDLWGELGLNIKNVLRKSMPDLLEAVYRSMEYCMGRKKIMNIDKILLTGGTSNLWGIDFFMSDALGIASERWNPLDYVECGVDSKKALGGFLSVALGLAVREWKKT